MRVFLNMGIYLEQIKCGKNDECLVILAEFKGHVYFQKTMKVVARVFTGQNSNQRMRWHVFLLQVTGLWHRFLLFVNLLVFLPFRYSKTVSFVVHRTRTCRFPAVRRAPTPLCQIKCQRKIIRCQGKYETQYCNGESMLDKISDDILSVKT